MSEPKRFDPYTGDPIPDEVVNQTGQAEPTGQAPVQEQPFPAGQTAQPPMQEQSTPVEPEAQLNTTPESQPEQTSGYVNPSAPAADTSYNNYTEPSQPNTTAYSAPMQSETQYNPYTGQPMNNANSEEAEEKDHKARIYGTVALIAGICSIVFSFCSLCCCPFLTVIAGVLGIIFGCLAKNSMNVRVSTATAGLITSIIGLVLCLLITLFMIVSSGDDFMEGFERGFKNGMNGYNFYEDSNGNTYDHHDFDYDSLYESDDFYVK